MSSVWGYTLQTDPSGIYVVKWEVSPVVMQVKLASLANLSDGHSLRSSVVAAMDAWNEQLGTVQFSPALSTPGGYRSGNGVNEVVMDSTVDGDAFPAGTLAITVSYANGNDMAESDIVFNTAYTWNSYRGTLRSGMEDIQRVAIHELGHSLGLDHPDQAGQFVTAIMNSRISSIDRLQPDDIAGGVKLYGPPGFVPPNDAFASATVITLSDGLQSLTGSNLGANREPGEPNHATATSVHSVWWRWTAPANATVTLTTLGSNFDTTLAVYTGSSVGSLSEIVSNDDEEAFNENAPPNPHRKRSSKVTFPATGGTTYHIAVDGWGDADSLPTGYTGSITLNLTVDALTAPVITSVTALSVDVGWPFSYQITATKSPTGFGATGMPPGVALDAASGRITGRPTATGTYAIQLGATNQTGTGTATLTLTIAPAAPAVLSQPASLQVLASGGATALAVEAFSVNGTPTYQWRRNGRLLAGATSSTLPLTNASMSDRGYYHLAITNSIGTTNAVVFVRVVPTRTEFVGWGLSDSGQLSPPASTSPGVDLAVSGRLIVQLAADGTVKSWGQYEWSQPTVPAGLSDVVMVATGTYHSIALRADGTVIAWGETQRGQAVVPTGLSHVMSVAAGSIHSLALKTDGTVVAWGSNDYGQCSVPANLGQVVAIAAGVAHSLALKADGTVVRWGREDNAHLDVPPGLNGVAALSAGERASFAVRDDGTVVAWGLGSEVNLPGDLDQVIAVAPGLYHALALKEDGSVIGWGHSDRDEAVPPVELKKVFAIGAGNYFSVALRDASADTSPTISAGPASQAIAEGNPITLSVTVQNGGAVKIGYQWRKNGEPINGATGATLTLASVAPVDAGSYDVVVTNVAGSTTSASATLTVRPLPVVTLQTPTRQVVKPGEPISFGAAASGTGNVSLQWYHDGQPISGATSGNYTVAASGRAHAGVYWVAATDGVGTRHSAPFFVLMDQALAPVVTNVVGWGSSFDGHTRIPATVTNTVAISAGGESAAALKADGTVVLWGGDAVSRLPTGLTDIVAVSVGAYTAVALKSDGTVVTGPNATPAPTSLRNVVAIACGGSVALALKTDGTVVTWVGEAPPAGLRDVVAIAAGSYHAVALKRDGTVVTWGQYGPASPPPGLNDVTAVTAGSNHSLALKADGSVVVWGQGYNSILLTTVPASVSGGVVAISAGISHALALKADGTVVAWGDDANGKTAVPSGLHSVVSVAAGFNSSFALRRMAPDDPPLITTQPLDQYVNPGWTSTLSVAATGVLPPTYQWLRNGRDIAGATGSTYTIFNGGPEHAGIYAARVTSGVSVMSDPVVVGYLSDSKVRGSAAQIAENIRHVNGNTYDQILLQGTAATIRADEGQVTRLSYVDLSDDIVQVEFSGRGSLTINLEGSSGPAAAVNYLQPGVSYMKGHASIVIADASRETYVSVFSVGRINAVDQSLFRGDVVYDGVADIAGISIHSTTGEFGGVLTANASYWDTQGLTGIYAPGVTFTGPIYIGDIGAESAATPVIQLGGATAATQINGGSLLQPNGAAVQVGGLTRLGFVGGVTSHDRPLPATLNQGRLEEDGVDVTAEVVVNPSQ